MAEIAKGFGVYGAGPTTNKKGAMVMSFCFGSKTPAGATQHTFASEAAYSGLALPGLTGLNFSSINVFQFFIQGDANEERTIKSYDLSISHSSPLILSGCSLNFGLLGGVNSTIMSIVQEQTVALADIPPAGAPGDEFITANLTGPLNYTPTRNSTVLPYITLGSVAPATFNWVLTLYFSPDLV